jgi:hypothetical protein
MSLTYLEAFDKALGDYKKQEKRNCPFGFFSKIRHSDAYTADRDIVLQELRRKLESILRDESKSDKDSQQAIIDYLKAKSTVYYNHSFSMYLLDQLEQRFPGYDWQQYNPQSVVFYHGTLYRGCPNDPKEVFKAGLKATYPVRDPNKVVSIATLGNGIATSKDWPIARQYVSHYGEYTGYIGGFLYHINYRGNEGVDIAKTMAKRGDWISYFFCAEKREVSIMHRIMPKDIIGCENFKDGNGSWMENPSYEPTTKVSAQSTITTAKPQ